MVQLSFALLGFGGRLKLTYFAIKTHNLSSYLNVCGFTL